MFYVETLLPLSSDVSSLDETSRDAENTANKNVLKWFMKDFLVTKSFQKEKCYEHFIPFIYNLYHVYLGV